MCVCVCVVLLTNTINRSLSCFPSLSPYLFLPSINHSISASCWTALGAASSISSSTMSPTCWTTSSRTPYPWRHAGARTTVESPTTSTARPRTHSGSSRPSTTMTFSALPVFLVALTLSSWLSHRPSCPPCSTSNNTIRAREPGLQ